MPIPTVTFRSGQVVPALGQGTWAMGDDPRTRDRELDALRTGLDAGLTLVDTAEMYGAGRSEELVGEVISGRRDEVFVVSKVLPSNATRQGTIDACHASLRRLGTDRIDLYLLHWRGRAPLAETVDAFSQLMADGAIGAWGVSNLDGADLADLPAGAEPATDQILYNLTRRGPEFDLLPSLRQRRIPVMAYSPVEQGRLLGHPELAAVADRHDASTAQIALAWTMRSGQVVAIPKASSAEHVLENARAVDIELTADDLADLDAAFPPPTRPRPLEMI
ncbi:aldo/keto reductase [Frigoribacterium sp. 2-23]|uniref:aldo/keto reductase n=1 Tax=Frigoribacterium sp. 2-23 TaxID=3415006 RepID=UPI003C6F61D9